MELFYLICYKVHRSICHLTLLTCPLSLIKARTSNEINLVLMLEEFDFLKTFHILNYTPVNESTNSSFNTSEKCL